MKDLIQYFNTYGKKTFQEMEFTEIDAMILVQLSYLNFEKVTSQAFCHIKELSHQLEDLTQGNYATKRNGELFELLCQAPRFCDIEIGEVESVLNDSMQYAVMTFRMDNAYFIVFRGTDMSIAGWKEDLNLGISQTIDSHLLGVEYASKIIDKYVGSFTILGHSKGGNIALFVGMKLPSRFQKKVQRIYDFDGPGFAFDLENDPAYQQIQDKYVKFVPKDDVIGLLLNHSSAYQVVDSKSLGFMQHDLYFWKIHDTSFKKLEDISFLSKIFSKTMLEWLDSMTQEEKLSCIQALDELFKKANITNLNQLKNLSFEAIRGIIFSSIQLPFKQKKQLTMIVFRLMKYYMKASIEEIKPKKNDTKD